MYSFGPRVPKLADIRYRVAISAGHEETICKLSILWVAPLCLVDPVGGPDLIKHTEVDPEQLLWFHICEALQMPQDKQILSQRAREIGEAYHEATH